MRGKIVRWSIVATAATAVAAAGMLGSTASASAAPLNYVALGDSSVSGSGVPIQVDPVCTRSSQDWPTVAAANLGAKLTDVSCGGATVADFSGKQFGFVAPQYDALKPERPLAARRALVALARFEAAHSPTSRTLRQTYQIALRLQRGEELFQADE